MKINSYEIGMDSARTSSSYSTRKFSMGISAQKKEGFLSMADSFNNSLNQSLDTEDSALDAASEADSDSGSSVMDTFKSMQTDFYDRINARNSSNTRTISSIAEFRDYYIRYLWQVLFGEKHKYEPDNYLNFNSACDTASSDSFSFSTIKISLSEEFYYSESETTSFSSVGNVCTEDGREISFSLDVEMSRSFSAYYKREGIPVTNMIDPLVINFTGDISTLSDSKFYFDLDSDGEKELISAPSEGSGFLALDKNNDGTINDGSELFGTSSGDGFGELAKLDSDGNGWIDENDSVWKDLKIWVTDKDGKSELSSLKDKNVGAIFLGNSDTDFSLRSGIDGSLNGAIRKTGIFLYEDGSGVGMINHLDIAN